jgi:hypothetical protein
MSDDENKVVDLSEERVKRSFAAGEAAHAAGDAFALIEFDWNDDALGFIDDAERPIMLLVDPEQNAGICMSRGSAEKLIANLTQALQSPHAPWTTR